MGINLNTTNRGINEDINSIIADNKTGYGAGGWSTVESERKQGDDQSIQIQNADFRREKSIIQYSTE